MFFLGGDRIYIKPQKVCSGIQEQLIDCLQQALQAQTSLKLFKLNFFVDSPSNEAYAQLVATTQEFARNNLPEEVLLTFIAQPPLSCKVIAEACYYNPDEWQAVRKHNRQAIIFRNQSDRILIGTLQANENPTCRENAEQAFRHMQDLLNENSFSMSKVIRQWNYIENILGFDSNEQRYQAFNNVRSKYYGTAFQQTGYPAATGIGTNRGGIIIEFVAIESKDAISKPVDNPEQIAAHAYSEKVLVGSEYVLKTTPKFERARYLQLRNRKMIFISGTASIIGERTIGVGNPIEQTRITIENIRRLYSPEILKTIGEAPLQASYGHARVYVKNRKDYHAIKQTFERFYGQLPVVYIIADVCRDDLLVEIEGKVILE